MASEQFKHLILKWNNKKENIDKLQENLKPIQKKIKMLIINNLVLIACIVLNIYSYTLIYICGVVITCFSCATLSQLNRTT